MLNSVVTGSGERTIVFVHGNSQSLHTWDAVVSQDVLKHYTRVAVDLPGHGGSFRSTSPEIDYSATGLARHLNTFLQEYAGKEFILVGTSLGTSVISELNPFPASCKGAMLCGAMMSSVNITVKDMIQAGTSVTAAFKADPSEEEIDYLIAHFLHQADAQVKQHYKADFKATDPNLRAFLGQSLGRPPVIDKVANMIGAEIPVAIVYGAQERLVQYDYLKKTGLPFWHNQIFRIDNAGHCVELDQPVALSGLLQAFAHDCFGR